MEEHQALFTWGAGPSSVSIAGNFNDWSATATPLIKQPDGSFKGSISVPWGSTQAYKYIVDGDWMVREDEEKDYDAAGNHNNIYVAPPGPTAETSATAGATTAAAGAAGTAGPAATAGAAAGTDPTTAAPATQQLAKGPDAPPAAAADNAGSSNTGLLAGAGALAGVGAAGAAALGLSKNSDKVDEKSVPNLQSLEAQAPTGVASDLSAAAGSRDIPTTLGGMGVDEKNIPNLQSLAAQAPTGVTSEVPAVPSGPPATLGGLPIATGTVAATPADTGPAAEAKDAVTDKTNTGLLATTGDAKDAAAAATPAPAGDMKDASADKNTGLLAGLGAVAGAGTLAGAGAAAAGMLGFGSKSEDKAAPSGAQTANLAATAGPGAAADAVQVNTGATAGTTTAATAPGATAPGTATAVDTASAPSASTVDPTAAPSGPTGSDTAPGVAATRDASTFAATEPGVAATRDASTFAATEPEKSAGLSGNTGLLAGGAAVAGAGAATAAALGFGSQDKDAATSGAGTSDTIPPGTAPPAIPEAKASQLLAASAPGVVTEETASATSTDNEDSAGKPKTDAQRARDKAKKARQKAKKRAAAGGLGDDDETTSASNSGYVTPAALVDDDSTPRASSTFGPSAAAGAAAAAGLGAAGLGAAALHSQREGSMVAQAGSFVESSSASMQALAPNTPANAGILAGQAPANATSFDSSIDDRGVAATTSAEQLEKEYQAAQAHPEDRAKELAGAGLPSDTVDSKGRLTSGALAAGTGLAGAGLGAAGVHALSKNDEQRGLPAGATTAPTAVPGADATGGPTGPATASFASQPGSAPPAGDVKEDEAKDDSISSKALALGASLVGFVGIVVFGAERFFRSAEGEQLSLDDARSRGIDVDSLPVHNVSEKDVPPERAVADLQEIVAGLKPEGSTTTSTGQSFATTGVADATPGLKDAATGATDKSNTGLLAGAGALAGAAAAGGAAYGLSRKDEAVPKDAAPGGVAAAVPAQPDATRGLGSAAVDNSGVLAAGVDPKTQDGTLPIPAGATTQDGTLPIPAAATAQDVQAHLAASDEVKAAVPTAPASGFGDNKGLLAGAGALAGAAAAGGAAYGLSRKDKSAEAHKDATAPDAKAVSDIAAAPTGVDQPAGQSVVGQAQSLARDDENAGEKDATSVEKNTGLLAGAGAGAGVAGAGAAAAAGLGGKQDETAPSATDVTPVAQVDSAKVATASAVPAAGTANVFPLTKDTDFVELVLGRKAAAPATDSFVAAPAAGAQDADKAAVAPGSAGADEQTRSAVAPVAAGAGALAAAGAAGYAANKASGTDADVATKDDPLADFAGGKPDGAEKQPAGVASAKPDETEAPLSDFARGGKPDDTGANIPGAPTTGAPATGVPSQTFAAQPTDRSADPASTGAVSTDKLGEAQDKDRGLSGGAMAGLAAGATGAAALGVGAYAATRRGDEKEVLQDTPATTLDKSSPTTTGVGATTSGVPGQSFVSSTAPESTVPGQIRTVPTGEPLGAPTGPYSRSTDTFGAMKDEPVHSQAPGAGPALAGAGAGAVLGAGAYAATRDKDGVDTAGADNRAVDNTQSFGTSPTQHTGLAGYTHHPGSGESYVSPRERSGSHGHSPTSRTAALPSGQADFARPEKSELRDAPKDHAGVAAGVAAGAGAAAFGAGAYAATRDKGDVTQPSGTGPVKDASGSPITDTRVLAAATGHPSSSPDTAPDSTSRNVPSGMEAQPRVPSEVRDTFNAGPNDATGTGHAYGTGVGTQAPTQLASTDESGTPLGTGALGGNLASKDSEPASGLGLDAKPAGVLDQAQGYVDNASSTAQAQAGQYTDKIGQFAAVPKSDDKSSGLGAGALAGIGAGVGALGAGAYAATRGSKDAPEQQDPIGAAKTFGTDSITGTQKLGTDTFASGQKLGTDSLAGAQNLGADSLAGAQKLGTGSLAGAQKFGTDSVAGAQKFGTDSVAGAQNLGTDSLAGAQNLGTDTVNAARDFATDTTTPLTQTGAGAAANVPGTEKLPDQAGKISDNVQQSVGAGQDTVTGARNLASEDRGLGVGTLAGVGAGAAALGAGAYAALRHGKPDEQVPAKQPDAQQLSSQPSVGTTGALGDASADAAIARDIPSPSTPGLAGVGAHGANTHPETVGAAAGTIPQSVDKAAVPTAPADTSGYAKPALAAGAGAAALGAGVAAGRESDMAVVPDFETTDAQLSADEVLSPSGVATTARTQVEQSTIPAQPSFAQRDISRVQADESGFPPTEGHADGTPNRSISGSVDSYNTAVSGELLDDPKLNTSGSGVSPAAMAAGASAAGLAAAGAGAYAYSRNQQQQAQQQFIQPGQHPVPQPGQQPGQQQQFMQPGQQAPQEQQSRDQAHGQGTRGSAFIESPASAPVSAPVQTGVKEAAPPAVDVGVPSASYDEPIAASSAPATAPATQALAAEKPSAVTAEGNLTAAELREGVQLGPEPTEGSGWGKAAGYSAAGVAVVGAAASGLYGATRDEDKSSRRASNREAFVSGVPSAAKSGNFLQGLPEAGQQAGQQAVAHGKSLAGIQPGQIVPGQSDQVQEQPAPVQADMTQPPQLESHEGHPGAIAGAATAGVGAVGAAGVAAAHYGTESATGPAEPKTPTKERRRSSLFGNMFKKKDRERLQSMEADAMPADAANAQAAARAKLDAEGTPAPGTAGEPPAQGSGLPGMGSIGKAGAGALAGVTAAGAAGLAAGSGAFDQAKTAGTGTLESSRNMATGALDTGRTGVAGALDQGRTGATGAFDSVRNAGSGALDSAHTAGTGAFGSVRDSATGALGSGRTAATGVFDSGRSAATGALDAGKTAGGDATSFAQKTMDSALGTSMLTAGSTQPGDRPTTPSRLTGTTAAPTTPAKTSHVVEHATPGAHSTHTAHSTGSRKKKGFFARLKAALTGKKHEH
ncbi:hypothetical protein CcaverHIS631_0704480 [Cutaneotrichosporon cavernicola]|nr:hypothetical protein CcaverHIS631_0704480 [Cutaneotrichosporon cavernicola]BEJ10409.1 hypothetical protein CcaverHIS641_0704440 [Cutaneotrichosporon cavernicola]